jgi:cyclopropane-fatty-acyl-phospholipid synthase
MRFLPMIFRRAVQAGSLELRGPDGYVERFGGKTEGPEVAIRIAERRLDRWIAMNPELRAAEAYIQGGLEIEQGTVYDFISLFYRSKRHFDLTPTQIFWRGISRRGRRLLQHNPVSRARRNAAHHYDLGNDFYRLWLDADMQYSCAYWEDGTEILEEAQVAKKRHIAAKLALAPGQRVLDIGSGWGGLALYLAQVADVRVTGITLAAEQLAVARRRAEAMGLADRVEFRLQDYREVTETFDRVVSVGMLEHVGAPFLSAYFLKVRDCLSPGGVALIHSIGTKAPPTVTGPFLRKYIFPGGYAPALSETHAAIERAGLWPLDVEIWRLHYARTLAEWRARFEAVRPRVVEMYDERFARMWELYLCAAECSFRYASSMVFQLQLGRERDLVPLTRDYLGPAKAALAGRETGLAESAAAAKAALDG